jgi:hypothetical protein
VGELDPRRRALSLDETHHARERLDVAVVPDTEVLLGDPALGADSTCLDHD